jgi:Sucrose synthase.
MISKILIVSIHGWFAQDKVLGRPDTGGQVVYILDQARALEQEMRGRLARQGVDIVPRILIATRLIPNADGTSCDQRLEPVQGADNVQILRVPFRTPMAKYCRSGYPASMSGPGWNAMPMTLNGRPWRNLVVVPI